MKSLLIFAVANLLFVIALADDDTTYHKKKNDCQKFPCRPNERCVLEGRACIPERPGPCPQRTCVPRTTNDCIRYPCGKGQRCIPDKLIVCVRSHCPKRRCVTLPRPRPRPRNDCQRFPCRRGQQCILDPLIRCIRSPCPKRRCVTRNPCDTIKCGGNRPRCEVIVQNGRPRGRCVVRNPCFPVRCAGCVARSIICQYKPNCQLRVVCGVRPPRTENPCNTIKCGGYRPRCEVIVQKGRPRGRCVVRDPCFPVRCAGCVARSTICQYKPNCQLRPVCGVRPPRTENPCNLIDCPSNRPRCEVIVKNGRPTGLCVVQDPCQLVRCANCVSKTKDCPYKPNCPKTFKCGAVDTNPCSRVFCGLGKTCKVVVNPCLVPPCPKEAKCVDRPSTCAATTCAVGFTCVERVINGVRQARCVRRPGPTPNPCHLKLCPPGQKCKVKVNPCLIPPCPTRAECVFGPSTCAATLCQTGTKCVEKTINGVRQAKCIKVSHDCRRTGCPRGQRCKQSVAPCLVPPCLTSRRCVKITRPSTKPGLCPQPRGAGICVELCSRDNSCPGRQKCCRNGCGHTCQNPKGYFY